MRIVGSLALHLTQSVTSNAETLTPALGCTLVHANPSVTRQVVHMSQKSRAAVITHAFSKADIWQGW